MKRIVRTLLHTPKPVLFFFGLLLLEVSCRNSHTGYLEIQGDTMGSSYMIKYKSGLDLSNEIATLLDDFNHVFSTYDTASILSKFNNNTLLESDIQGLSESQCMWLKQLFKQSFVWYHKTEKAFNPALGPLLSYWGFGDASGFPEVIDSMWVDSLRKVSDFGAYGLEGCLPIKGDPRAGLNFNAIAAGMATDIIGDYLEAQDIRDYLINVTGEVKAKGLNPFQKPWKVSIEKPLKSKRLNPDLMHVHLDNQALATSGNYRNYFERDGEEFGHTLSPDTGFPVRNSMLSATVISRSGAQSDALATAFMVMGFEASRSYVEQAPALEAVLVYVEEGAMETWVSWEQP